MDEQGRLRLEQHVNQLTVLIDGSPQALVLATDPDEDIAHEYRVAVAAVSAPQAVRVPGSELFAPEADRLVGDDDSPAGQEILDVPVAQVEAVVESDRVLNDLRRKPMALV